MAFSGPSNFAYNAINGHTDFNAYMSQSGRLQSSYPVNQASAYPLFHSAAVAAVAAAAAGYSQQLNAGNTPSPLNLTAATHGRGAYSFQPVSVNQQQSYYPPFALHHPGMQQVGPAYGSVYGANSSPLRPVVSTAISTSSMQCNVIPGFDNTVAPFFNGSHTVPESSINPLHRNSLPGSSAMSAFSTPKPNNIPSSNTKSSTKSSNQRTKKSATSEELSSRKRQEFEELVKARTDKLMSDGPSCSLPTSDGPQSSFGTTGGMDASQNYRKLTQTVLDAKKRALLQSPAIVAYLQSQQHAIEHYKQQTDLFRANVHK